MSFGYSIGDVIAIAGATERIIAEVKSYREAPLHFRRLAIELGFLSEVCNQVFTLQPTLPEERSHIERIRAIAMHCLGPLRAFEERMRSYDNTFGMKTEIRIDDFGGLIGWAVSVYPPKSFVRISVFFGIYGAAHASGVAAGNRLLKLRNFSKRLHWSAIARHEVDELRAILTSEILAINVLVTMHEWSSLKSQQAHSQGHIKQLQKLLDTTAKASADIRKSLIDAKLASEHLQSVMKNVEVTQSEQFRILKTIEGESSAVYCSIKDMAEQQRAHTTKVEDATSTQITRFFSLKEFMEQWIKTIVDHCKQIIAIVQRNTELLLSIHGLLAKLETLLAGSRIDLPSIVFENVLGTKMLLPFQLCDTWEGFARLLEVMFFNKPGSHLVAIGKFLVMQSKTNRIIAPHAWSTCVVPGDQLSMSIILERLSARNCPRCRAILSTFDRLLDTGMTCPSCSLWLSTNELRQPAGGVSSSDSHSPVPMPQPEKIRFGGTRSRTIEWELASIREQSLSLAHKAKFKRSRLVGASGASPATPTPRSYDMDMDDIESFRRIHVQPYKGDFLRALFEIGEDLRTLLIDVSAVNVNKDETTNVAPFARRYTDIITDFEALRNTNISPSLEITNRTKHVSDSKRIVMKQWVSRTAQLLIPPQSFAIQPSCQQAMKAIRNWLLEGNRRSIEDYFLERNRELSRSYGAWCGSPENLQAFQHYHGLLNPRVWDKQQSTIHTFQRVYDPGVFRSVNCAFHIDQDDLTKFRARLKFEDIHHWRWR